MKLNGQIISPNIEVIVLPRNPVDLIFKTQAVLNFDDFEKLCPQPIAPKITRPGGVTSEDIEDPDYKEAIQKWALYKTHWMMIKSLSATDGLVWDTVNLSDPDTWENYMTEMSEAGLSPPEISRIMDGITTACGLNEEKIEAAQKRFLATQVETQEV